MFQFSKRGSEHDDLYKTLGGGGDRQKKARKEFAV
jgi:hypothetical protein